MFPEDIQPGICTDIRTAVPLNDTVYDIFFPSRTAVCVREYRSAQPHQSESGRCKPQIALIIDQHMVDRAVKCTDIDTSALLLCVQIPDTVIRTQKDLTIFQHLDRIHAEKPIATDLSDLCQYMFLDLIDIHLTVRSSRIQRSALVKRTALVAVLRQ